MNMQPQTTPFMLEEPQPLVREAAPAAPYPVEALGPLRAAVEDVKGLVQAPLAIPAQSALALASLAVQGFANVQTLGGYCPISLYSLTIAKSGERKTSCDGLLMAGLRDFEKCQTVAQRSDLQSWQNDHAAWKAKRDGILNKGRGKGDKAAMKGELDALGPEPEAPPAPDRTVSEPTFEGLTKLFQIGQPSLGIFSDEGGQFLGGHAMNTDNRQKTLAALNDLWGGNPIKRSRGGDGTFTLYDRRLAIHLMAQPGVARSFMADPKGDDTGFLPRFLITEPETKIGTRLHALSSNQRAGLDGFNRRLRELLEIPLPMDEQTRALQPRLLDLSPEARQELVSFSDEVEWRQAKGGDLANVTGYASKAAEQACRIAAVLTLWRDLEALTIPEKEMCWGIALARFYLSQAQRLSEEAVVSENIRQAEALRVWLLDGWPHAEIVPHEVAQSGPIRALRNTPAAKAALGMLAKHGWVVQLDQGAIVRGSPRTLAYRIVRSAP